MLPTVSTDFITNRVYYLGVTDRPHVFQDKALEPRLIYCYDDVHAYIAWHSREQARRTLAEDTTTAFQILSHIQSLIVLADPCNITDTDRPFRDGTFILSVLDLHLSRLLH
jgi:hypothetical protein